VLKLLLGLRSLLLLLQLQRGDKICRINLSKFFPALIRIKRLP
jgi:hypothetical protein